MKIRAANRENLFLQRFGDPSVNSMGDDVIEFAEIRPDLHQIHLHNSNILQPQALDFLLSKFNRFRSKVHSYKLAARKSVGHRNQVVAIAAGEFQHAAMFYWRGIYPMKSAHHRESVRMGLQECEAGI